MKQGNINFLYGIMKVLRLLLISYIFSELLSTKISMAMGAKYRSAVKESKLGGNQAQEGKCYVKYVI